MRIEVAFTFQPEVNMEQDSKPFKYEIFDFEDEIKRRLQEKYGKVYLWHSKLLLRDEKPTR